MARKWNENESVYVLYFNLTYVPIKLLNLSTPSIDPSIHPESDQLKPQNTNQHHMMASLFRTHAGFQQWTPEQTETLEASKPRQYRWSPMKLKQSRKENI